MPFSITNQAGGQILRLEGDITILHAQDLAAELGDKLKPGSPLAVDTGGLAHIDTCILQLLYSLHKTVSALSFDPPSEAFLAAVDRRGLRREMLGAREGW